MKEKRKRERTDPNNLSFMRVNGRPPTITDDIIQKIGNAIKVGNYVEVAAALNGISKQCLYKWFKKGQSGKGLYGKLVDVVQQSISYSEARDVAVVDKEAQGRNAEYDEKGKLLRESMPVNWKAAAWRLERKHPDRWGRREQVKLFDSSESEEFTAKGSHDSIMELIDHYNKKAKEAGEE